MEECFVNTGVAGVRSCAKTMKQADVEAARKGDLQHFQCLDDADQFAGKKDEDGRWLLHTACTSGSLDLLQLIVDRCDGKAVVNDSDDEVCCYMPWAR